MLQRIHLTPCKEDIAEQPTVEMPAIGYHHTAIQAPMVIYHKSNIEPLMLIAGAVSEFCAQTHTIPTCIYVSWHNWLIMMDSGFSCYYAAIESQSGYQEVPIGIGPGIDDETAICVGQLPVRRS